MTEARIDWTSMAGVVAVAIIACFALWKSSTDGVLVASAAVGGICGWLARGAKTANIQNAENVQADGLEVATREPVALHSDGTPPWERQR